MTTLSDPSSIRITKGLDIALAGKPEPVIEDAPRPSRVALQPGDFRFLRPRLRVKKGDSVLVGTPLFESKDDPRIVFPSPASGTVADVHFGARRRVLEIIVELKGEDRFVEAGAMFAEEIRALDREAVAGRLLAGGLWPMLRERPFSRIADPDGRPQAVFVGAAATEPHLPDPDTVLEGREDEFQLGLDILSRLTEGQVHLCTGPRVKSRALSSPERVRVHRFSGPHPSGSVSVQIYHVRPPAHGKTVWFVSAQDTLAIARFFLTGRFDPSRVIALGGPSVKKPRYFRARIGASCEGIAGGQVAGGELRYISGGVLTGTKIAATGFLGFYHDALCVLPEGRERELLSFVRPGFDKYSSSRAVASSFLPGASYRWNTNKQGSLRNFVMTGIYENVCPVDIIPDQLAKSVLAGDVEESEKHGILDCAECGLCSFVCPSKIEIDSIIRSGLEQVLKEI